MILKTRTGIIAGFGFPIKIKIPVPGGKWLGGTLGGGDQQSDKDDGIGDGWDDE